MLQRMLLLIMLGLPVIVVQAQVAQEDSLALVALYNATDGPNWSDNTNWLTGPVAQWFGVEVTNNRVTALDLQVNALTGAIPEELGNLTRLILLDLQVNALTGSIPEELGDLTNLTELFLSTNALTGAIPEALGDLTSLTELNVHTNALTGAIPEELGNLTHLQNLALGENQLVGGIPEMLGNLTSLSTLTLNDNQLTGSVPEALGNLTRLTALTLNSNMLSGVLPLSLTNLSMLDLFWFDNTNLCEPTDEAFQAWLQGISQVQSTGCTSTASEASADLLGSFMLLPNYPNPFNLQTTVPYALPEAASVRLVVYDALGRHVQVLVDGKRLPGRHEVVFEVDDLPSGVYFYRLEAGSFQGTGQMLLVR